MCYRIEQAEGRRSRPDLEFGLFVGQPFRLQPAFSRLPRCAASFSGFAVQWREDAKPKNCDRRSVPLREPPERRLQARLPAPPGWPTALKTRWHGTVQVWVCLTACLLPLIPARAADDPVAPILRVDGVAIVSLRPATRLGVAWIVPVA